MMTLIAVKSSWTGELLVYQNMSLEAGKSSTSASLALVKRLQSHLARSPLAARLANRTTRVSGTESRSIKTTSLNSEATRNRIAEMKSSSHLKSASQMHKTCCEHLVGRGKKKFIICSASHISRSPRIQLWAAGFSVVMPIVQIWESESIKKGEHYDV